VHDYVAAHEQTTEAASAEYRHFGDDSALLIVVVPAHGSALPGDARLVVPGAGEVPASAVTFQPGAGLARLVFAVDRGVASGARAALQVAIGPDVRICVPEPAKRTAIGVPDGELEHAVAAGVSGDELAGLIRMLERRSTIAERVATDLRETRSDATKLAQAYREIWEVRDLLDTREDAYRRAAEEVDAAGAAQRQAESAQAEAEAVAAEALAELADVRAESQAATQRLEDELAARIAEVERLKAEVERQAAEHTAEVERQAAEHAADIEQRAAEHTVEIEQQTAARAAEVERLNAEHTAETEQQTAAYAAKVDRLKAAHASGIERLKAAHASEVERLEADVDEFACEVERLEAELDERRAEVERAKVAAAAESERFDTELAAAAERFDAELATATERFDAQLAEVAERLQAELVAARAESAELEHERDAALASAEAVRQDLAEASANVASWAAELEEARTRAADAEALLEAERTLHEVRLASTDGSERQLGELFAEAQRERLRQTPEDEQRQQVEALERQLARMKQSAPGTDG
jgi:hypothetical protein